MQSTRSTSSPAAATTSSGSVSGLKATPTPSSSSRACCDHAREVVAGLVVHGHAVPAGLRDLPEMLLRALDHEVAVEHAAEPVDDRRDRLEDDRADRDRLDEVPVTDVEVEDAHARLHDASRSARRAARSRPRRATARSRRCAPIRSSPSSDLLSRGAPRRYSSPVMRRFPSGCTSSSSSPPAVSFDSVEAGTARHTVSVRPSTTPRAPMCGERARIWLTRALGRSIPVELAVGRGQPLRIGRPVVRLRMKLGRREHAVQELRCERSGPGVDRAGVVVRPDRKRLLRRDRACVELRGRAVDRHAGLGIAGHDRPLHRRRPAPAGKERRVDVQPERAVEQGSPESARRTRRRRLPRHRPPLRTRPASRAGAPRCRAARRPPSPAARPLAGLDPGAGPAA